MENPNVTAGISKAKKQMPRGTPFKKGQSGNITGRPKLPPDIKHVRELARQYTDQAIQALVEVLSSDGASAKVAAANVILDRGWGKAEQPIVGDGNTPLRFELLAPWLTNAISSRNGD